MTEEAVDNQTQVDSKPKVGPGPGLRAAREARNVSLEEVAKQLRIDVTLVRALEEDDYSKFAAPIYVTGYLRGYARMLGLAPESFIEAYQNLGAAAPSLERVAHLENQPQPSGNTQVPRWIVYVMIIAVVLGVALVWRGEVMKLLAPLLESSLLPQAGAPHTNGDGTQDLQSLPLPSPPSGGGDKGAGVSSSPPSVPAPVQTAPPPKMPDLPQAHLALKASKPSWVEVKDGNGKRLFYDLMVPGDQHTLEGVPPFSVLLGYARGVIVEYNGKQVDDSMYIHQDMARFRVGDNGTSKQ